MIRRLLLIALCAQLPSVAFSGAEAVALRGLELSDAADVGRVNARLAPGMRSFRSLSPAQQRARKRLMRGQSVPIAAIRELADLGDGAAAFAFGKMIEAQLETKPELAADAAHYFGIALATERGGAMGRFAEAVARIDPVDTSPARLDVLKDILVAYAAAGDAVARRTLLERHAAGRPFGALGDEIDRLVLSKNAPEGPEVALQLASEILQRDAPDRESLHRARAYLDRALDADSFRTRSLAHNLLQIHETRLAEGAQGGPR